MARSNQTEEQRKIAGLRLDNVIKEKGVSRKEVLTALHLKGFVSIDEKKLSDYTTGRRPIPEDVAREIAYYLHIDVDFLTDTSTFYYLAFEEETYSNYVKQLNFRGLKSSDFYLRFKEIYKLFGVDLWVYDSGKYELHGKDISFQLDRQEVAEHFRNISIYANRYLREVNSKADPVKDSSGREAETGNGLVITISTKEKSHSKKK